MSYLSYKNINSFDKRRNEAIRILSKYPNRIPIICKKAKNQDLPPINKNKYLVARDLTIGQFICVIRNRIKLPSQIAIFLLINGHIPASASMISELYDNYKDEDGFLYIEYCQENTFGSK
jgi:GABA(A) receptor-associated protein